MTITTDLLSWLQHDKDTADPRVSLALLAAAFFVLNFLFLLTYLTIIYPYFYSPFRHLPRPKVRTTSLSPIPRKSSKPSKDNANENIQGEIPLLGQHTSPYTKPLGSTYLKWILSTPNQGLITYRSILNQDRLLVTSPKAIAEVLVHNTYAYTKHPSERSVIQRFLGNGLTISEGEEHRFQRKAMTPIYALRNIRSFYGLFWAKGVELVNCLEEALLPPSHANIHGGNCGVEEEELNQWANRTTMDIIGLAALGRDFGCLSGDGVESDLFQTYQEIFTWAPEKDVFMALNRVLPRTLVQWLPWRVNERIYVTSATLRDACRGLVTDKMDEFRRQGGEGKDLISRMMRFGGWEAEGLVEQLLTIIAAGYVPFPLLFILVYGLGLLTDGIGMKRRHRHLPGHAIS